MSKTKKPEGVFDRIHRNPEKYTVYSGEAMLRDWDADSVQLWLADHGEQSPFQTHHKSPDDPIKGTRYIMVLIEIGDDQQPIDIHIRDQFIGVMKETIKPLTTPEKIVRQAGMLCRDSDFHKFVHSQLKTFTDAQKAAFYISGIPRWLTELGLGSFQDAGQAAEWCRFYLYYRCGVHSRKQLGFKQEYKDKFNQVLRDFNTWGRKHQQQK